MGWTSFENEEKLDWDRNKLPYSAQCVGLKERKMCSLALRGRFEQIPRL